LGDFLGKKTSPRAMITQRRKQLIRLLTRHNEGVLDDPKDESGAVNQKVKHLYISDWGRLPVKMGREDYSKRA